MLEATHLGLGDYFRRGEHVWRVDVGGVVVIWVTDDSRPLIVTARERTRLNTWLTA